MVTRQHPYASKTLSATGVISGFRESAKNSIQFGNLLQVLMRSDLN